MTFSKNSPLFALSFSLLSEYSDDIVVQNKLGGGGSGLEMVVMEAVVAKTKVLRSRWPRRSAKR